VLRLLDVMPACVTMAMIELVQMAAAVVLFVALVEASLGQM